MYRASARLLAVSLMGLVAPCLHAQTAVTLSNPGFDFTTSPSGSSATTGYTSSAKAGASVAFVPAPAGSTTDNLVTAVGWASVGSASAGYQRLAASQWFSLAPSGGTGYANNGGTLTSTITGAYASSRAYTLTGKIYRRKVDALPGASAIAISLGQSGGTPMSGTLQLGTETSGVTPFTYTTTADSGPAQGNLVITLGNTSSAYSQVNFDDLALSYVTVVLPPPVPVTPVAMAAGIYGSRPGTPFLFHLAAANLGTGRQWQITDLPAGLTLDPSTGNISGTTPPAGTYSTNWSATGSAGTVSSTLRIESGNRLALTPPIGWNSWNGFQQNVTAQNLKDIADAIVNSGLLDLGFSYVNLDDQWAVSQRFEYAVPGGGTEMRMMPDPVRFPDGLAPVAAYLHARGLKLGIYSDGATTTCAGTQPGSYGYEQVDARTFAEWGIDFVKYDYCNAPSDQASAIARYTAMGNAMSQSGRSMIFSICEWGQRSPWTWAAQAGGNMWRTTLDMRDNWQYNASPTRSQNAIGVLDALDLQSGLEGSEGPGAWNDPDMLMVGVDLSGSASAFSATGLNSVQERSMFSLWAIMGSPMIFNADLRKMDSGSTYYNASWASNMTSILGNTEVWKVNQDLLGKQGIRLRRTGNVDIWRKPLSDGSLAITMLNRGSTTATATVLRTDAAAIQGVVIARDLWQHKDLGPLVSSLDVPLAANETAMFVMRPARLVPTPVGGKFKLEGTTGMVIDQSSDLVNWQPAAAAGEGMEVTPDAPRLFWRLRVP